MEDEKLIQNDELILEDELIPENCELTLEDENFLKIQYEKEMEEYYNSNYNISTKNDNFIDNYILYASRLTDCPTEFHFLAAESILSIISDRKVYMEFEDGIKYLNTYLMAVAPPSAGKSSGFKIYDKFLRSIGFDDKLLPTKCTPETLTRLLSKDGSKVYTHDEYSVFLRDANEKKYNAGILNDILSFYDDTRNKILIAGRGGTTQQHDEFGNEISGDVIIKNLFFNQLVLIQDGAYAKHITDYDFQIGFPQRFQTVFAHNITYRPLKTKKDSSVIAHDKLLQEAITIKNNLSDNVKLIFTDEQLKYIFDNVETKYRNEVIGIPSLTNFPRRFNEQIYKLSGLLAMEEICSKRPSGPEIIITQTHIDKSIKYLSKIYFDSIIKYISEKGVEKIKTHTDFEKVLMIAIKHIIKRGGKISKSELTPLLNIYGQESKTFYQEARSLEKLFFTEETNPKTGRINQYITIPK